jgi:hypothetical protein
VAFGSGYFNAGNRSVAAKLQAVVDFLDGLTVPLWTLSSTTASGTSSASAGVETAVTGLTAPSSTYKAHTAYIITMRGLLVAGTTTGNSTIRIRDTNAAGTARFDGYTHVAAVTTVNTNFYYETLVANTTGADITSRILAITLAHSAAGGVKVNASTNIPYYFRCSAVGTDADYPEAVAL